MITTKQDLLVLALLLVAILEGAGLWALAAQRYVMQSQCVTLDEAERLMRQNERITTINQICVGIRAGARDEHALLAQGEDHGQDRCEIAGDGAGMRQFRDAAGGPDQGR